MSKIYPPPKDVYLPFSYEGAALKILTVRQHLANGVPVRELRRIWSRRHQNAKKIARLGGDTYTITRSLIEGREEA